jgi:hypothetical protein
MKKTTFLIMLITLVSTFVNAQDWKSKYDEISDFNNGFAKVKKGESWGFVDTTGKKICPIKYNSIDDFSEGLAAVKRGEKWGFINTKGKEICAIKYDGVSSFDRGYAAVEKNNSYIIFIFI